SRTNSTPSDFICFSTSARLAGSLVARGADSTAAITFLLSKNKKPRAESARGHVASTSAHSLHCWPVERTEVAEIQALRSMFAAVPRELGAEAGVGTPGLGEGFAVRGGFPPGASEVNHALGISTADQLDALPSFYGRTRHSVSPAPGIDLDGELRARG